jgi:hypothetical protein
MGLIGLAFFPFFELQGSFKPRFILRRGHRQQWPLVDQ